MDHDWNRSEEVMMDDRAPTCTDDASADRLVESSEAVLDGYAPGWRDLDRWVQRPSDLAAADANLVGGAVNGGTAQLFQQLVFRPVRSPGWAGVGHPSTASTSAARWARSGASVLRSVQRRIGS